MIFFITNFQNRGSERDHGFLWIKNAPMYGVHTNEEIEKFVDMYIFLVMYHYYQTRYRMHNNINTHVYHYYKNGV